MTGLITNNRRNEFSTLSNRLFNDFFDEINSYFGLDVPLGIFDTKISKFAYPRMNIIDAEKEVILEATVPGLTKDDVKVEWYDNELVISGGKEEKTESKDYRRREITKKKFCRSFTVYESLYDVHNINAKVENGLLTIKLPKLKVEEKKPEIKRIEVN